jgi:hypothetical protein
VLPLSKGQVAQEIAQTMRMRAAFGGKARATPRAKGLDKLTPGASAGRKRIEPAQEAGIEIEMDF